MPENLIREPNPRDWPEDFPHENGQYWCRCVHCEHSFVGHKRRVCCKVCATPAEYAEWLAERGS